MGHALERAHTDILCFEGFISHLPVRILGEDFSRIFFSFPNEHIGDLGIILWSILLLSWVRLDLMGFLLFVLLTSSILGFTWHKWR